MLSAHMNPKPSRRDFVAAAGIGAVVGTSMFALGQAPQALVRGNPKPVVISSANGNQFKDADGLTCVARAFKMMTAGADVLDAVVAGVNILELDPEETGVGYGGLPNAEARADSPRRGGRLPGGRADALAGGQ